MRKPTISLIVPVFNEESILEHFIRSTVGELQNISDDFEIIFVDDCSTDASGEILNRLAREFQQLIVIRLQVNTGIGHATVEGIKRAGKDVVFWNTVDRVIDTTITLQQALPLLEEYDVVSFYRNDLKANTFYQRLLTIGNNELIALLFPWKFKAYQQFQFHHRRFLDRVEFEADSTFIAPELLFKAKTAGKNIIEMPTDFHVRPGGKPKGGKIKWVCKTFKDIVKLWFIWRVLRRPMRFREENLPS